MCVEISILLLCRKQLKVIRIDYTNRKINRKNDEIQKYSYAALACLILSSAKSSATCSGFLPVCLATVRMSSIVFLIPRVR